MAAILYSKQEKVAIIEAGDHRAPVAPYSTTTEDLTANFATREEEEGENIIFSKKEEKKRNGIFGKPGRATTSWGVLVVLLLYIDMPKIKHTQ